MVDKKTIRDWFLFIVILLILPTDSRLTYEFRPQDWYGELRIESGERLFVVGKNSSMSAVRHDVQGVSTAVSLQRAQRDGIELTQDGRVLPISVTVMEATRLGNEHRRAHLDDSYFVPGPLSVLTRADLYNTIIALAIVLALFMLLGVLLARFVVDDQSWSTEEPRKEPIQQ